ncbi:acyl carrier protein [Patescibacteria group bacterium]|nr:acyl carrier protein [Patescibacteria group bacterium]MBU1758907.1 acyl carrier protein [Patescibacteria group bacterium]
MCTQNETAIWTKLQEVIMEKLGIDDVREITKEASLTHDLCADDLDVLELFMECEVEFDITIPTDREEGLKTCGDILNYILE